ncbi:IS1 transposase [Anatilimnocola aggregata]|uniref:IS1 transposase n=1 Tax=Anatilimnocola aggregata TaxID=2528021 RepID=A0A517YNJ2_9BACT|nr:IS1 family transposase [Anatilimnocola aggregata]QDU31798.1 IS1 transposase [Anatilimnocola aggregata]
MIAITCKHEQLVKRGKDARGNQRFKCCSCGASVVRHEGGKPLGNMRLEMAKAIIVLKLLLEGMSIRACERITSVNRDTICDLVLTLGQKCDTFLENTVQGVQAKYIELDEIWAFSGCKAKTAKEKNYGPEMGDVWTWFAIDAQSKMILSHKTGKRDQVTGDEFLRRLNNATVGRTQVTSDGFSAYTYGVPSAMGSRVDFAQLIKHYAGSQNETRYSPAQIVGTEVVPRFGNPDEAHVSTSYSERLNLSVRMHNRRLTRLTNAHSKSAEHHSAMLSIFTAFYNYCRKHESCGKGKQTPAMAAGLTDHVWSVKELLEAAA